jgi:hypothetical protein
VGCGCGTRWMKGAGRHILESALRIASVPAPVKLLADPRSAPVPVFHQERSNQPDVFGV